MSPGTSVLYGVDTAWRRFGISGYGTLDVGGEGVAEECGCVNWWRRDGENKVLDNTCMGEMIWRMWVGGGWLAVFVFLFLLFLKILAFF